MAGVVHYKCKNIPIPIQSQYADFWVTWYIGECSTKTNYTGITLLAQI